MTQNNDNNIMALKAKIAEKRKELEALPKRVVPITNCLLVEDNTTTNLHSCSLDALYSLLVRLNIYVMSAKDLGIDPNDIKLSDYTICDWMADVREFINVKKYRAEKRNLDNMEARLNSLLSEDKKTELEIEEISALLGQGV